MPRDPPGRSLGFMGRLRHPLRMQADSRALARQQRCLPHLTDPTGQSVGGRFGRKGTLPCSTVSSKTDHDLKDRISSLRGWRD